MGVYLTVTIHSVIANEWMNYVNVMNVALERRGGELSLLWKFLQEFFLIYTHFSKK